MDKRWWEDPACWLCDYWWVLLAVIVLALTAFFTRGRWLPLISSENAAHGATPLPEASSTAEFNDPQNIYRLAYPSDWLLQDAGNQAWQWVLPEGVIMSVHGEAAQAGDTLQSWAQEVVTRMPYDVIAQSNTTIGGQPAIRQEVAYPDQAQRIAVGYLVLHGGQKYQIALSGLEQLRQSEQEQLIQEFEKTLATFQFQ